MDVRSEAELRRRVDALAAKVSDLERVVSAVLAMLCDVHDTSVIVYRDPHAQAARADARRDKGARR